MHFKGGSFGFLGTALSAATSPLVVLSSEGTLRDVEVIFYDKDKATKSVKVPIDNLSNSSYFKYKVDESFKGISSLNNGDDGKLYLYLANLASKYIQVQHHLNVVKYSIWDENNDQVLQDSKCCPCCKQAEQNQCQCPNGQCCYMCLGCYSDNVTKKPDSNCCTANGNCDGTELKKHQKTFKKLRGSVYSGYYNTYLSPVQVNIKFTDKTFENIKNGLKESSPSQTDYTLFIGSLTYGFVDYSYNQATYKSGLLGNDTDSGLTNENTNVFFSTIPQRLASPYKLKLEDDILGVEALKKYSIDALLEKMNRTKDLIDEYKNKKVDALDVCCKDSPNEEEVIKCLLGRTYVFLSKESNDLKVADIIKELGLCCSKE